MPVMPVTVVKSDISRYRWHRQGDHPMANTYTQLYIQIVFAVKYRKRMISRTFKEELHKYITGIIQNHGHKLLTINCLPDHSHILVGLKPHQAISDLVREIKASSSAFINERRWFRGKFQWQNGFGAFSYAKSELSNVIRYIDNQEEHHRTQCFRDEFLEALRSAGVEHDERYIFSWPDDHEEQ